MASLEAVQRRRANRAAARMAKENRQKSREVAAAAALPPAPTVEAVAPVPKRKSGGRRLRERAAWERAVAERMAIRFDPKGEVLEIFRLDYRYWECRAAGFDPEAKVVGYRDGVGKLVGGNVYLSPRLGTVRDAIVYDWWWDLDPATRTALRMQGRKERHKRGHPFTHSIF